MKIGITADSGSDIPFDWAKKHNIKVVPLYVTFNGQTYKEDESFDHDAYYNKFDTEELFRVTTAQPAPADFMTKYKELVNEGCTHIICVTISSGLSGTYNSAFLAAQQLQEEEDIIIHVIDSKSVSVAVLYLLELAVKLRNEGLKPEQIVHAVEERINKIKILLTLPTLKYLRAGGRVSFPKFLIGSIFGLKPITEVNMETGKNEAIGTIRNMKKGIRKLYELTTDEGKNFANHYSIVHTNDISLSKELEELIRKKQSEIEIRIIRTRSSLSAHTGTGAVALISLFEKDKS